MSVKKEIKNQIKAISVGFFANHRHHIQKLALSNTQFSA